MAQQLIALGDKHQMFILICPNSTTNYHIHVSSYPYICEQLIALGGKHQMLKSALESLHEQVTYTDGLSY